MDLDDIKDGKSLQAWLKGQTKDEAFAISLRSAMRVAPIWLAALDKPWARESDLATLPILRALASWAHATDHTFSLMKASAESAADDFLAADNASRAAAESAKAQGDLAAAAFLDFAVNAAAAADFTRLRINDPNNNYIASAAVHASRAAERYARTNPYFFDQIREDARRLQHGGKLSSQPLWTIPLPDWFKRIDVEVRVIWAREPAVWSFWTRWWDGVLSGQQLNWDLQRDVALIPDVDWQKGPAHIAGLIAKLEGERQNQNGLQDSIEHQIALLPDAASVVVTATRVAIAAHRLELPATMAAVLGYIDLEIARLQSRNYQSDDDRDESLRQIRVLLSIHETVSKLNVTVTSSEDLTELQVVEAEKLSRLFVRKFQEWPRANVDELVDNCWRVALVGATAALLPMIGVPTAIAASAGIVLFGGKKIVDGIKAAKDALSGGT